MAPIAILLILSMGDIMPPPSPLVLMSPESFVVVVVAVVMVDVAAVLLVYSVLVGCEGVCGSPVGRGGQSVMKPTPSMLSCQYWRQVQFIKKLSTSSTRVRAG